MPKQCLIAVYFAMIHPHIQYGIELYANTSKKYLKPLITLNNKILRILQSEHIRTHTNSLYTNYNALNIPLLFRFQVLKFVLMFYNYNSIIPVIYSNYFAINNTIHTYDTRQSAELRSVGCKKSIGQRSIMYLGVKLWNEIDSDLKGHMSIHTFKRILKKHFITRL